MIKYCTEKDNKQCDSLVPVFHTTLPEVLHACESEAKQKLHSFYIHGFVTVSEVTDNVDVGSLQKKNKDIMETKDVSTVRKNLLTQAENQNGKKKLTRAMIIKVTGHIFSPLLS